MRKTLLTVLPAVALTAVSMVLTLAVVVMWLGAAMPWPVALVVGLGLDGGWLATLAYERRLAAQGDHSTPVTAVGWCFGTVAAAVLIVHAFTEPHPAAWLAVAWLPIAAKALWLVHSLWEDTALTSGALTEIRGIRQEARDEAAVARARLRAQAVTEVMRVSAVTEAGARVARATAKRSRTLADAWAVLASARDRDETARALTCVTGPVTGEARPAWELPRWESLPALTAAPAALTDAELDHVVREIREAEHPPLSYRETARLVRKAGHPAAEMRLRAAWRRVTADQPMSAEST
jgi:hypothetical protein